MRLHLPRTIHRLCVNATPRLIGFRTGVRPEMAPRQLASIAARVAQGSSAKHSARISPV